MRELEYSISTCYIFLSANLKQMLFLTANLKQMLFLSANLLFLSANMKLRIIITRKTLALCAMCGGSVWLGTGVCYIINRWSMVPLDNLTCKAILNTLWFLVNDNFVSSGCLITCSIAMSILYNNSYVFLNRWQMFLY